LSDSSGYSKINQEIEQLWAEGLKLSKTPHSRHAKQEAIATKLLKCMVKREIAKQQYSSGFKNLKSKKLKYEAETIHEAIKR
jgi:hypothetical protein